MEFESYIGNEEMLPVMRLLQQAKEWQQLDVALKKDVPISLHSYFQVACVKEHILFIYANNAMAARRLKMLASQLLANAQLMDIAIQKIEIKVSPKQEKTKEKEPFQFKKDVLNAFEKTAQSLPHQSRLANALIELVKHQKSVNKCKKNK